MWEIKRSSLISRLNLLDSIPEKVGLSSSEFFWIRGNKDQVKISVASYIMGEVELPGTGDWPKGDFFIDRRVFLPFIYAARELKDKSLFQFEVHKHQLVVTHGRRVATFDSQKDVKGYGDLRKVLKEKAHSIPVTDNLQELLICGQTCAISDSMVSHLNCVYLDNGHAAMEAYAASDKVFYFGEGDVKQGKVKASIPFPLFLIKLLSEQGLKKVSWMGKYIVMHFEKGIVWQPISAEAEKNFPVKEIRKHAKKANTLPVTFTTSSRRMSKLMVRLSYYLQAVRRKDWVVKIKGRKGTSVLGVTTNIPGVKFDEVLAVTDKLKHDLRVEWPLDVLEATFRLLSQKTKKLGMIVRVDKKRGISYITAGQYWLAITSKKEE